MKLIVFFTGVALIVSGALLTDFVVSPTHDGSECLLVAGGFLLGCLGVEYILRNISE